MKEAKRSKQRRQVRDGRDVEKHEANVESKQQQELGAGREMRDERGSRVPLSQKAEQCQGYFASVKAHYCEP